MVALSGWLLAPRIGQVILRSWSLTSDSKTDPDLQKSGARYWD
jgi:hypothetical protein